MMSKQRFNKRLRVFKGIVKPMPNWVGRLFTPLLFVSFNVNFIISYCTLLTLFLNRQNQMDVTRFVY